MGVVKAIAAVFGVVERMWDWFFSPARQKARAKGEVDKAIATHDEKKVNEILDRHL